jgi:hypothetical protein
MGYTPTCDRFTNACALYLSPDSDKCSITPPMARVFGISATRVAERWPYLEIWPDGRPVSDAIASSRRPTRSLGTGGGQRSRRRRGATNAPESPCPCRLIPALTRARRNSAAWRVFVTVGKAVSVVPIWWRRPSPRASAPVDARAQATDGMSDLRMPFCCGQPQGVASGFLSSEEKSGGRGGIDSLRSGLRPKASGFAHIPPSPSLLAGSLRAAVTPCQAWRKGRDSNPRNLAVQRFSRPPR